MNNRVLSGAIIAFIILLGVIFFCFWAGKSLYNRLRGTNEPTVNQPNNQPPPNTPALPTTPEQAQAIYLALGNPSNCGSADPNNYSLVNNYMVICYNRDRGIPNWVAWRVTKADLGSLNRENAFRPDDRLPKGWNRWRASTTLLTSVATHCPRSPSNSCAIIGVGSSANVRICGASGDRESSSIERRWR